MQASSLIQDGHNNNNSNKQGQKKMCGAVTTVRSNNNSNNNGEQMSTNSPVVKSVVKRKLPKAKKSSCRKNYKKLKSKLKGLIEEGVMLKETLKRKQDQLIEMSRDIHYVLGRLLPYQDKLTATATTVNTNASSSTSLVTPSTETTLSSPSIIATGSSSSSTSKSLILPEEPPLTTPVSDSTFDSEDTKSHTTETSTSSSWDYVSCPSNTISVDSSVGGGGTGKNRINFCLSERQLASIMSDRPPLTLPENIFQES